MSTDQDLAVIASAATAAGTAPNDAADYIGWRNRVQMIAMDLHKLAEEVIERTSFLKTFTFEAKDDGGNFPDRRRLHAIIIGVDQHPSGRSLVGVAAGRDNAVEAGKLTIEQAAAQWREHRNNNQALSRGGALNELGIEQFRTDFLNTDEGSSVFAAAESLIGQRVVIFKDMESFEKDGQTTKMRIVRHVEPSGALGPVTQPASERQPAPREQAPPPQEQPADNAPAQEDPKQEAPADETSAQRAERLLALSPDTGEQVLTLAVDHFQMNKDGVGAIADGIGITDRSNLDGATCKRIWDEIVTSQLGETTF